MAIGGKWWLMVASCSSRQPPLSFSSFARLPEEDLFISIQLLLLPISNASPAAISLIVWKKALVGSFMYIQMVNLTLGLGPRLLESGNIIGHLEACNVEISDWGALLDVFNLSIFLNLLTSIHEEYCQAVVSGVAFDRIGWHQMRWVWIYFMGPRNEWNCCSTSRLLRVSPTNRKGSQSTHWDNIAPMFTLQPAPCMDEVPKLSPVVSHWSL
ncbi:hypothetical protein Bca101_004763 [Brassica carinata]